MFATLFIATALLMQFASATVSIQTFTGFGCNAADMGTTVTVSSGACIPWNLPSESYQFDCGMKLVERYSDPAGVCTTGNGVHMEGDCVDTVDQPGSFMFTCSSTSPTASPHIIK